MVRLTSSRFEIDHYSGRPKQPWWKLGNLGKINIFIGVSIVVGLGSFIFIRDDVMSQRRAQMKLRKEAKEKVERQIAEQTANSEN